jgi:hypothetical protein
MEAGASDRDRALSGAFVMKFRSLALTALAVSSATAFAMAPSPAERLRKVADVVAHYDIDVRLPGGSVARLKVDPQTRQIAWRNPAIVAE